MDATKRGRRSRPARVVLISAVMLLTACGTSTPSSGHGEEFDGDWVLAEGTGPEGTVELDIGREEPVSVTLRIDGDAWSGTAACNSYDATVTLDDGVITGDPDITMTEMACDPPELMAAESSYLAALADVEEMELTSATDAADALTMTGPGSMLRFTREPEGQTGSGDG